jgi:hypothetical protein
MSSSTFFNAPYTPNISSICSLFIAFVKPFTIISLISSVLGGGDLLLRGGDRFFLKRGDKFLSLLGERDGDGEDDNDESLLDDE